QPRFCASDAGRRARRRRPPDGRTFGVSAIQRRHAAPCHRPLRRSRAGIRSGRGGAAITRDRAPESRAAAPSCPGTGATRITAEPTDVHDLRAPRTLEDAGLSRDLVTQLVLKTLHFSGEITGTELARRLGLPFMALEPVVTAIKQQHQVEIAGG